MATAKKLPKTMQVFEIHKYVIAIKYFQRICLIAEAALAVLIPDYKGEASDSQKNSDDTTTVVKKNILKSKTHLIDF